MAPCDNLPGNGQRVAAAVEALARVCDAGLADWIAAECRFAGTMVDSITPASDAALQARVTAATGLNDAAAVQRERFAQWVIEDVLPPGGPDLASVGVVMTHDVAGFERAKLRILNGAHSSLAYLGLLRGADTVAAAMADPVLAGFVERMVRGDVLPGVPTLPGFDLDAYVDDVLMRFRNPAIRHRLAQIAIDGSQKLPYRLLDSVAAARADGRPVERLMLPVAAWMRWIARAPDASTIDDPLAPILWATSRDGGDPVARFMDLASVFPATLRDDPVVRAALLSGWHTSADMALMDAALASLARL
jgi:fructuronate reductase